MQQPPRMAGASPRSLSYLVGLTDLTDHSTSLRLGSLSYKVLLKDLFSSLMLFLPRTGGQNGKVEYGTRGE